MTGAVASFYDDVIQTSQFQLGTLQLYTIQQLEGYLILKSTRKIRKHRICDTVTLHLLMVYIIQC